MRIVLLEDDDLDAELLRARLERDGLRFEMHRARGEATFEAALRDLTPDVILSDFSLPGYDGILALEAAKRALPHVPFVFVSGAIGEERAIETLRRGATDYVLKDRLERLSPAVRRAVGIADERRRRVAAEAERDRLLVSEREARRVAEEANRMKDEFLAVVSHELRTPLNAILGWSSLLVTGERDPDLLARGLVAIERNARVQARLIEDILDISRIVTGKLQIRAERTNVARVVSAAVDAIRPAADAKQIALAIEVEEPGDVLGDADRLQQVVWNLLSNAVKFTPARGRVVLRARRDESASKGVVIEVSDTGPGIEPTFLPHIFERFRQADSSATRKHGGLGLGLAIVRHLTELHGGVVHAASDGHGAGATFVVRLPPAPSAEGGTNREALLRALSAGSGEAANDGTRLPNGTPSAPRPLGGLRVLAVDDEADTLDLLAITLTNAGATVTTASSANEALEHVRASVPDVIVSDVAMPQVDGYAFLKRLRALEGTDAERVPAIAVTAYARDVDRQAAERAGFQRHLAKPVTPASLVATILEIVRPAST
jgi:signal transduction histidine kinase